MQTRIRSEKVSDIEAIHALVSDCFDSDAEACLVKQLRDAGALLFSLLVEDVQSGRLLAHLALSPVTIDGFVKDGRPKQWQGLGLAPLCTHESVRGQGLASQLLSFWFEQYADPFFNAVFVLGDPAFYQRFAFQKAADVGFLYEGNTSEYFQVRELSPGFVSKAAGNVFYHPVFSNLP